jgi:hypothetical protein
MTSASMLIAIKTLVCNLSFFFHFNINLYILDLLAISFFHAYIQEILKEFLAIAMRHSMLIIKMFVINLVFVLQRRILSSSK